MRRKSERVVKTSPTKKTEPTNRRTTRRGRKSPEKTVNDDESENSSDQASSSDNEPEEIVPPKRTRRTSRTIEKSSSAEEVKATTATTTTRPRRRGAKKEQDIQEEEDVEADQTTIDEPKQTENVTEILDEKLEATSVDSSTEPATSQIQVDTSNNSVEDVSEKQTPSNETENVKEIVEKQEAEEKTEITVPVEPVKVEASEPVESSRSRRRTLKRVEREINHEVVAIAPKTTQKDEKEQENEVKSQEKSPEKKSVEEVKSSDDTKIIDTDTPINRNELQNGSNVSDAADTTAKDTTASDTEAITKQTKKKPIVRKRKWLTNKTAAPKVQEITISTDSLKGLISDVKPVPLSDVQLDSSPEADHESDDVKVVSSTSTDFNQRNDDLVESTDDGNPPNISTSRKISIVNESEGEQPLSPAKHNPCNILYITNLVRPFTVLQLKSLLLRTGKIAEDGFWIDKIKSKCFVKYETEDEAVETRHALHGIRWPTSNPKCLNVDFGTESLMEKAISSTADEVKPTPSRDERVISSNDVHEIGREKALTTERPVREWDLGKKDSHRLRETDRVEREKEREQKPQREIAREFDRERGDREREREHDRDRERNRNDRRLRRSHSASPNRKFIKKDNEPPLRLLDDLFRKTKTTPCIYWLPLTSEQIAVRVEERKKAIERREAMRKEREREREREEAEEKNRRREREKRREESEEKRSKRREDSREKSKRRDDSRERERSKRRDDSRDRRERPKDDKRRRY